MSDTAASEQAEGEDILDIQIRQGVSELQRPTTGLSAGLDIGFGPLIMAVILTAAGTVGTGELTRELLLAIAYGVGFILVVLGRSELFTEHTALAGLPVLGGQADVARLARLWVIVYLSNLVGGAAFVWLIAAAIGIAHLPRCIAGSVEVVAGTLVGAELGPMAFVRFLSLSTVGNVVGGTVFVALLEYGHVVRSGPTARDFGGE